MINLNSNIIQINFLQKIIAYCESKNKCISFYSLLFYMQYVANYNLQDNCRTVLSTEHCFKNFKLLPGV